MSLINLVITPHEKDLGGFSVRRILPHIQQRMVGPFIFLDHLGPAEFAANSGIDVRPHPHIGLATVTYLFQGELFHRDTLGNAQLITPGAVNWMTAGCGIAHSERTATETRTHTHAIHGLQSWVALPKAYEEIKPEFFHHPTTSLPEFFINNIHCKLVLGKLFDHESSVKTYSSMFYLEINMPANSSLTLPNDYQERALYLVDGCLQIGDVDIQPKTLPVFKNGEKITITAKLPSRLMLLGGEPFSENRFIWWNFVSSSEDRILQAKTDWLEGRFGKVSGDEKEFIPLPEK